MTKKEQLTSNPAEVHLPPELQQDLQRRLTHIEGHVRDMDRMLGEPNNCESLLIQATAVRAAIDQVMIELLEGHLEVCMAQGLQAGADGSAALEQFHCAMVAVLKRS